MFRHVAQRIQQDAKTMLDKDIALGDHAGRMSYSGGNLSNNLQGHHGWEDRRFSELSVAAPRF